jgi:multidrug efflux system outer membrane protein
MLRRSRVSFKIFFRCLWASALLPICGCQLIKPYHAPLSPTPFEWKNTSVQNDPTIPQTEEPLSKAGFNNQWKVDSERLQKEREDQSRQKALEELDYWWEIFDDPTLNKLESQALEQNYSLKAAFERILEARAIARINEAALYPSVNFAPVYSRSQSLILSPFSIPTTTTTPGTIPPSSSTVDNHGLPKNVLRFLNSEYALAFNFQYEVDLWNKLHNTYYASVYRAQEAVEDYYNVLLSLTAEVAINYFQMRDLDFQLAILEDTIRTRRIAFEINRDRFKAGLLTYLDVSRAEVQVTNAESDRIDVKRARGIQENVIAALIGTPPSVFGLNFDPVETPPPKVPVGIPSELLCRRPDILAAERELAATYAEIGVAYAGFFPSLNLNAAIGLESPVTSILLDWKARMWQIGANVLQVIYDAGKTQADVDLAQARFREQYNHYQDIVINAFKEVENALVNLRERADQAQALRASVKYAQLTFDLSYMRYRQGLVTFLDVADAERDLLQAKQNFAIVLGDRYSQTVKLIQALGGSWGPCDKFYELPSLDCEKCCKN